MLPAPILTIKPPAWASSKATRSVMDALNGDDGAVQSFFVGGCVRNYILDKAVQDIDIATVLTPDVVMERLKAAGIQVIPTGIDHGTVTAVIKEGDKNAYYEITTFRNDMITDGRRAVVAFSDNILDDAKRRDFTMNALYMDGDGNVYDPLGCGYGDCKNGLVRFVGEPSKRITEDALRILRFFRFQAFYGVEPIDVAGLRACNEKAELIHDLSLERVTAEFLKILSVDDPVSILKIMFDNNVLSDVHDSEYNPSALTRLCEMQGEFMADDLMARLFVLSGNRARFCDGVLRLSHAEKKRLVKLDMVVNAMDFNAVGDTEKAIKKAIYFHGNDVITQGYLIKQAIGGAPADAALMDILQKWQAPKCPINGQMLMDEGFESGPELGRELEYRTQEWLDEVL